MPRWLRLLRGMLGTGLVFGGGMFVVTGILSLTLWLRGKADAELIADIMGMGSVAAFILGVGFSGVLAIAARGKGFDRMCDPTYRGNALNGNNLTGALPDAPVAGRWFQAQFAELVRNAYPPFEADSKRPAREK